MQFDAENDIVVRHAGNRLVERSHEPADRAEMLPDDVQAFGIPKQGEGGLLNAGWIVTIADRPREYCQPTLCDVSPVFPD